MSLWASKKRLLLLGLFLAVGLLVVFSVVVIQNSSKNDSRKQPDNIKVTDSKISSRDGKTEQVTLLSQKGTFPYNVEIASTDTSRQRGLSGRDGLAPNTGMLFVFSEPGYDCFWMKDMKFDIDMLWFDEYQSLVHVQENASKTTYPSSFCPQAAASYVLEVPAGTVKQLGLQVGDRFVSQ